MKQLICTILLSFFYVTTFCQSKVNEDRQTILTRNFQEFESSPTPIPRTTAPNTAATQVIPGGSRFTIVDETTLADYYIVYFWEWTGDSKTDLANKANINFERDGTTVKYFVIKKNQLDVVSEKIFRRFSPIIGALTFPFKYRPQTGKFETTFSIGVAAGVTWDPKRLNEHTFSFMAGISASSARVDKYSADPATNITDPSERTSVTISLSFLYQWERLQLGIIGGIDNILDNEILNWKYQGKGWLSFGVGVSLFSANEVKSPGKN